MQHIDLAANIRAELARNSKSQGDLAELLGITRQGVSQRLLGRVDFRLGELRTISEFLGVTVGELVDGANKASA